MHGASHTLHTLTMMINIKITFLLFFTQKMENHLLANPKKLKNNKKYSND
jgi:hypothetical protein